MKNKNENEKMVALCKDALCYEGAEICCRDCEKRKECPEVCDGLEGVGVEAECEWRE